MTREMLRAMDASIREQDKVQEQDKGKLVKMNEPLLNAFRSILSQHISNPETRDKVIEILSQKPPEQPKTREEFLEMSRANLQRNADRYNQSVGNLDKEDGIDCPICKNKGFIEEVVEGFRGDYTSSLRQCECMKQRKSLQRLKKSGMAESIEKLTFATFETTEDWQKSVKERAQRYVQGLGSKWFFIGGAVGCGKTHICTAICGELLKQNMSIKYMSWSEESVKLKGKVNDDDFDDLIRQYKDVDVLYIDDFFKTRRSRTGEVQYPSDADIKLAYQIINFRYTANKKTIISSEWILDELMNFDDATSSRIYEMCRGGSMLQIDRLTERNYRMRFAV